MGAERLQIYIPRHMRLDDPADPAMRPVLEQRLEGLVSRSKDFLGKTKRKTKTLNRLRYHAKHIGKGTGSEHDWRKVCGAIDELVVEGVPASSLEIREILLPILYDMPDLDDLPQGFELALREIDRYLANLDAADEPRCADAPSAEVAEAARLLVGKTVLLVGDIRRPEAHRAIKAAFGLEELVWFETRPHESIDVFEPYVARPEVALVILAIRWSSHSFEGVKRFCDRQGKPMARLPGGYGVNQVAAQVLAQCSRQLERNSGQPGMEAA